MCYVIFLFYRIQQNIKFGLNLVATHATVVVLVLLDILVVTVLLIIDLCLPEGTIDPRVSMSMNLLNSLVEEKCYVMECCLLSHCRCFSSLANELISDTDLKFQTEIPLKHVLKFITLGFLCLPVWPWKHAVWHYHLHTYYTLLSYIRRKL